MEETHSPNINEENKDFAFQSLSAVREAVSIAKRLPTQIRYEDALDIIHDVNPAAYEMIVNELNKKNKSELVRYYIDKADALTDQEEVVTPQELILKDFEENEVSIKKSQDKGKGKVNSLNQRRIVLLAALNYFKPREISEHKVLSKDFYLRGKTIPDALEIYKDEQYVDYRLPENKYLRLRLLHPDKYEHILGCDMIYEQFDLDNEIVRFVHVQYKLWDKEGLYYSKGNLKDQLQKMKNNLCDVTFCTYENQSRLHPYRFPFCSGFLRPTDKQKNDDKDMVSTGLHLPICYVNQMIESGDKKITKKQCKKNGLSHSVFDELFVNEFLGSRWMPIASLERYYKDRNIDGEINLIRIHAQEIVSSEVDKETLYNR